jgi:periplasmic protein TonB
MTLKDIRYPAWTRDRFMVFLVMATSLHVLVVFGLGFGISLTPPPRLADTLDVVLVQWRSESEPEEADYLAQATQKGGGDTLEDTRPSETVSGPLPGPQDGADAQQSRQQVPQLAVEQREIIAADAPSEDAHDPNRVEQAEEPMPDAAELVRQSMEMASLQPELSNETRWKSKLPRREFISANTREYEFASYMSAWVSKVERVGNLNYPAELRARSLHGDLVLTVGIRQNGTIESIDVRRSSGIPEIDRAAVRIVRLAAPYSPLPDNIADRVDILHITRTWRFESAFAVSRR